MSKKKVSKHKEIEESYQELKSSTETSSTKK